MQCVVNSCSELPPVVDQSRCVVWCEQLNNLNTPDFTESKSCSVNRTGQPDVLKSCSVNKALGPPEVKSRIGTGTAPRLHDFNVTITKPATTLSVFIKKKTTKLK